MSLYVRRSRSFSGSSPEPLHAFLSQHRTGHVAAQSAGKRRFAQCSKKSTSTTRHHRIRHVDAIAHCDATPQRPPVSGPEVATACNSNDDSSDRELRPHGRLGEGRCIRAS
jgi:hypothetical protein